jgi:catechol 2,3-dioxygenase-like lactoylglutathione lyase family enzyme
MPFEFETPLDTQPRHIERVAAPIAKATDIAYLRYARPDLDTQEVFFRDFGLLTAEKTGAHLLLCGAGSNPYSVIVEKAAKATFLGLGFDMPDRASLEALSKASGQPIEKVTLPGGGERVRLTDPNGFTVDALHGRTPKEPGSVRTALAHNTPFAKHRINQGQRGPIAPPDVVRLGHVVLMTPDFEKTLHWFMTHFGVIPTDVLCLKDGTPALSFNRCDRGQDPADHHTLVVATYPVRQCDHVAFEVNDLDAVALGQQVLKQRGHTHEWGIGRHILGSQIFDYWSDRHGAKFEHFADGDVYTSDYETGYHPMSTGGLYQWGQDLPAKFMRPKISVQFISEMIRNLATVPTFTIAKLKLLLGSVGKARPWI